MNIVLSWDHPLKASQPKGAHPGCLSEVARRVNLVGNAGEGDDCNPVFTQRDLGPDA